MAVYESSGRISTKEKDLCGQEFQHVVLVVVCRLVGQCPS